MRVQPFTLLLAAAVVAAGAWLLAGRSPAPTASATTSPPAPAVSSTDPAELERLIPVFEQRFTAYGGVTNGVTLGRLYRLRARVTGTIDDYGSAYDVLSEAWHRAPASIDLQSRLAQAAADLHRFREAHALAIGVLDREPSQLAAIGVAADAALALGRYDEAERWVSTLDGSLPGRPEVLLRQAAVAEFQGDAAAALAAASAAIEAAGAARLPPFDQALYRAAHGTLALDAGFVETALESFDQALAIVPAYGPAMEGRAMALAQQGELSAAVQEFEANPALDLHGHLLFADVLTAAGAFEHAGTQLAEARRLEASDTHGLFARQIAEYELRYGIDIDRARMLADQDLADRPDAAAYDLAAWAAYHDGDLSEARRLADIGLRLRVPSPMALYHSGAIWAGLGDVDNALQDVTAAMAKNPLFHVVDARDARSLLDDLLAG